MVDIIPLIDCISKGCTLKAMSSDSKDRFKLINEEVKAVLAEDLDNPNLSVRRIKFRHMLHFILLVYRSFIENRCLIRAAALAYTTLLALVPVFAVVIAVTTSLLKTQEGEKQLEIFTERFLSSVVPQLNLLGNTNIIQRSYGAEPSINKSLELVNKQEVIQKVNSFVNNVQSGALGITGVISLIAVAILLLSRVETMLNDIWGVKRGRSWFSRVVLYWTAITLGPLVLLVVIGLTTGPMFTSIQSWISKLPLLSEIILFFLPFVILSNVFALFYQLMPNTRVKWSAAIIGGTIGGCLWQLNNMCNVIYVSKVVSASKIYGSLGVIPIFLVGLYVSWLIVLLGAQVTYNFQNRKSYIQGKIAAQVNHRTREKAALQIMIALGEAFIKGSGPAKLSELSNNLGIPARLTNQLLECLQLTGLVVECSGREPCYLPARPLEKITCFDIINAVRSAPGKDLPLPQHVIGKISLHFLEKIRLAEEKEATSILLSDIAIGISANRAQQTITDNISKT